jgi:penicillin G amidase
VDFRIKPPKPAGLSISRDSHGVPHVAADELNGAMWGTGYCHATDRTTQLLMMRILGQGRLCELLSDTDESLEIDRFFRRANWHNNLDQQVALLDDDSRDTCQAYCDGVNAGLAARKIYALKLMGYRPDPWTIADSILIMRMTGYLTLAQSQAEIERFFVELVQAGVDSDRLAELFPVDPATLDRDLIASVTLDDRLVPNEVLWNRLLPRMMGSNNWVVSGNKTASGAALMANDPHLEVNRLPNVWYEQSMHWKVNGNSGAGYLIGMGMPGLPGLPIGRNERVAWGATYTFMDSVDSWVEDCKDGRFRRGTAWESFAERTEVIRRKNHDQVEQVFYENSHGVLQGDPFVDGRYLSTRWSSGESGAISIMTSLKMASVATAEEAMDYLGAIETAWNWVIADQKGNIAYQMSGLMPQRNACWNGFTPAPGWDSQYDWQGFVARSSLPSVLNPEDGYFATANQDLNRFGKVSPINMPMGDYRARRIEELLARRDDHDLETTAQIQLDLYSAQARLFLDILLPLLEQHSGDAQAAEMLLNWDLKYDLESRAAVLFERFFSALRQQVFGEPGLGKDVITHLTDQTGIFIDFYQNFDRVLLNESSRWHAEQTRDQSFIAAFEVAAKAHDGKQWQEKNAVPFVNLLFQGKLPASFGFDTDAIPLPGGRATPRQGQIYVSNGRQTSFAPSIRMVADMGAAVLHTSLAGGPSDNRFSKWYKSGIQRWMDGCYDVLEP